MMQQDVSIYPTKLLEYRKSEKIRWAIKHSRSGQFQPLYEGFRRNTFAVPWQAVFII